MFRPFTPYVFYVPFAASLLVASLITVNGKSRGRPLRTVVRPLRILEDPDDLQSL